LAAARILDWGCGHGRIIRHFDELVPDAELHGVDIDADNVDWIQRRLPCIKAIHGPLMPPLPYQESMFDCVFGLSVMTHLTETVQHAWLKELRRITRPGALVMLTFSGDTDVAFTSRALTQNYIDDYLARGRGADLPANDLASYIDDPDYYKNVKISASRVRRLLEPYFEVIDILECMFGYQDLAVLRCSKP
jgi:cyclopropane fatty-acyl-phospholipid synthase-like methyltransferase